MLQPVGVAQKHLADYQSIAGRKMIDEIRERAARLQGKRILHVSATAFGGGVSEILNTLVPLMIDVGLECEWQVIYGREEFFNATKVMHNALQGSPQDLSEEQWQTWVRYNEINASQPSEARDVCIIHDPPPGAIRAIVPQKAPRRAWGAASDPPGPDPSTRTRPAPSL